MIVPFLIAIGLNFDTFSVAVVEGAQIVKPTIKDSLKVSLLFGIGQALMALIGSVLGLGFKLFISHIDHWIAFILLSLIGIRLIRESGKNQDNKIKTGILNYRSLILLVLATSIDALIIGITFAFVKNPIIFSVVMIAFITGVVSFVGFYAGNKLKKICGGKSKLIGGFILISIGLKVLLQHIFFGN